MKTSRSRRDAASRKAAIGTRSSQCTAAKRVYGRAGALVLIIAADICAIGTPVHAGATPLPPQRPTSLAPNQNAPASPEQVSPQSNAPTNMPPDTPPAAADEPIRPGVTNEGPGTLLKLPSASHTRMHQCAVEWQNMKTTGAAVEKTWFNFALKCLTR